MSPAETPNTTPQKSEPKGTCQVCGAVGPVVYDPERPPPNKLCYKCAAEYAGPLSSDDDE